MLIGKKRDPKNAAKLKVTFWRAKMEYRGENFFGVVPTDNLSRLAELDSSTKTILGGTGTRVDNWKTLEVTKGQVYEVYFDVSPTLQNLFKASAVFTLGLPWWYIPYFRNPSGFAKALINRILDYSFTYGLVKEKVQINSSETGFTDDYSIFKLTFSVIENPWPFIAFIAAVLGICSYLTVREVRLIKEKTGSIWSGIIVPVAIVAGMFLIYKSVPQIIEQELA